MKTKHYHNTTNQDKEFVKKATKKCKSQEDEVMQLMQRLSQATASEIWKLMDNYNNIPITSPRRVLSNLAYEGKLTKTDKTKIGLFGAQEHYYKLSNSQLDLLF